AFGEVVGVQPPFPLGNEFDAFEGLTLLVGEVFHGGYCSVIAATMTIVFFLLIDNINGVRRVPRFQRNQLAISTKFSLSRDLPGDQPSRAMTKSCSGITSTRCSRLPWSATTLSGRPGKRGLSVALCGRDWWPKSRLLCDPLGCNARCIQS